MRVNVIRIFAVITFLQVMIGLSGCTSLDDYMKRGMAHFDAGRYEKAELEFKNVLSLDPKDNEARYYLALSQGKQGRWKSAYYQYKKIIENNPKHILALTRLSELYISSNIPDLALKMTEQILAIDPGNKKAILLRAKAYAMKDNLKKAMDLAHSAFDDEKTRTPESGVFLATMYAKKSDLEKGISVLEESIRQNPEDKQLLLTLAEFLLKKGDSHGAIAALDRVANSPIASAGYRVILARLYLRAGEPDKTEQVLRATVQAIPDNNSVKLALIEFLANRRDIDTAIHELQAFIGKNIADYDLKFLLAALYEKKNDMQKAEQIYREIIQQDGYGANGLKSRRKMAAMYLKHRDTANAKKLLDEVLMQDSIDFKARLLRASISAGENDTAAAFSDIDAILKREPDNVPALTLLAKMYLSMNEVQKAEESLHKAAMAEPGNIRLQLQYSNLLETSGKNEKAVNQLNTSIEQNPGNPWLMEAKIKLLSRLKNWDEAEKAIKLYKEKNPESSRAYYLAGMTYQAMGNAKAARAEYEKALQYEPAAQEPLAALVKSYITENRGDLAISRVERVIKEQPKSVFALELLGEAQLSEKKYAEAEHIFRKAIELQPGWSLPYISLGDMLLFRKRTDDAIGVYKEGIEKSSNSNAVHLKLCMAYEHLGLYDRAIGEYDKILEKDPSVDVAANNLAMLLVTHKQDEKSRKTALEIVKRFEYSHNLAFKDTMAWVLYKNGEIDSAISYLLDIVKLAPNVPEFHYHLGMAYHDKGYTKLARHHLELAVKGKDTFAGYNEARSVLANMNQ